MRPNRQASRKAQCSNNFKQIGLAIHNYHSAFKRLPLGAGGTGLGTGELGGNQHRLGGLVALLPFVEQQALWDQIANPYADDNREFPSMGPAPWVDVAIYAPFATKIPTFQCPSDPSVDDAGTNYAFCYGDGVDCVGMNPNQIAATHILERLAESVKADPINAEAIKKMRIAEYEAITNASQRGMFASNKRFRFRDTQDGLCNTIMMTEVARDTQPSRNTNGWVIKNVKNLVNSPIECQNAAGTSTSITASEILWPESRGYRWADGNIRSTGMNTVLPPNSASCSTQRSEFEGVFSAGSQHSGGVHVLMGDGAVVFMADSIDCGNADASSVHINGIDAAAPGAPSPYGLWGTLGTRAGNEFPEEALNGTSSR